MDPETLDEILVRAEEAATQPPPPPGGIPRQWVPGWFRWPICVLALPWILFDLYLQKLAALHRPPAAPQRGRVFETRQLLPLYFDPGAEGPAWRV